MEKYKKIFALLVILALGAFLNSTIGAAETIDIIELYEVAETESAGSSSPGGLIISPSEDNPKDVYYNSGDRGKAFLRFDVLASTSVFQVGSSTVVIGSDVTVNKLVFDVKNSFSSAFLNPLVTTDNIGNVMLMQEYPVRKTLATVEGFDLSLESVEFVDLDILIEAGNRVEFGVYADIVRDISDDVSAKILMTEAGFIEAVGAEGQEVDIEGRADGEFLDLFPEVAKADIIVTEIRASQGVTQSNLVTEDETYITVIYQNVGTGEALIGFDKDIDFGQHDGWFEFISTDLPVSITEGDEASPGVLIPYEGYTEVYQGKFINSGPIALKVSADSSGAVNEIDDNNNSLVHDIMIDSEVLYPDFIVENIKLTPPSPRARESVKVEVIYKNIGADYARNQDVLTKLYLGDIEGYFQYDVYSPMETNRPYPSEANPWKNGEQFIQTFRGYFTRERTIHAEAAVDAPNLIPELKELNNDFEKDIVIRKYNAQSLTTKLKGKIVLRVEQNGEAYYINPGDETIHFLGRPEDAFAVMRSQGVGITNSLLNLIPVGTGSLAGEDSDSDGLPDMVEDAFGTDKHKTDSDSDGYGDFEEVSDGYNPVAGNGLKRIIDYGFADKQIGKIFLQVERNGEAWYVNPADSKRYFLGRPEDAFRVMRQLGLGISENDFNKMD